MTNDEIRMTRSGKSLATKNTNTKSTKGKEDRKIEDRKTAGNFGHRTYSRRPRFAFSRFSLIGSCLLWGRLPSTCIAAHHTHLAAFLKFRVTSRRAATPATRTLAEWASAQCAGS